MATQENTANGGAHEAFWRWFKKNGQRLRNSIYGKDERARQAAFDELHEARMAVCPEVIFEFGHAAPGAPLQLVVSADGKFERVNAVKEFVATAPPLDGWEIVAFRPRMQVDHLAIELEGERVQPEDISFAVAEDEDGLKLTLYVKELKRNERMRGLGASLLAEHAVGERDALTLLSSLQTQPLEGAPKNIRPFQEIVTVFDQVKQRKYPPPGSLSLGDGWSTGDGEMHGAVMLLMLNCAIRPFAGHPDYDRRLEVHIHFNDRLPNGLPGSEEYAVISELDDRLSEALQRDQQTLHVLTTTSAGMRNLVFYTSNAAAAQQTIDTLTADFRSHRVESTLAWDTYWEKYRSFFQALQQ